MKLTAKSLTDRKIWEAKGFGLPSFDREAMIAQTLENPTWIHFGAGNIFRGFPAALQQSLLDEGKAKTGIIVGEGFDYEIIDKIYQKHDNLTLMVTLKSDGSIDKQVIASVAAAYKCDPQFPDEWETFKKLFRSPSLQMVTFTITEKGYGLKGGNGEYYPAILADFANGPKNPSMFLAKLTALVYERYLEKQVPLTLLSMDNCSHNGEKLQAAVTTIAKEWISRGLVEKGFHSYLTKQVAFPWSMIDKITPRPDANVKVMLEQAGFEDTDMVITDKHTYIAPFVNAEECQYLVIEDTFPNGRPELESTGVYFTDRETVNKVEKMKVCTCLNPLHTALAIFGCLLGYTLIADEMKDPLLNKLVHTIGYVEGMPVVVDPKILDPRKFIGEVLEKRIPNPFMPDTPQRIATDTSQKLGIRFGETIKAYMANDALNLADLKLIPLVFAGWIRYLMGIDDEGNTFTPSSDPRLEQEMAYVKTIKLGDTGPFSDTLKPILSDESIFGVDLYETGLAPLVETYFTEMVAASGAIRATLQKHVK
ncbi:mannitol dehydrogenase family protein [uncultured Sphaerochaeta sp.]|uniref:mannitol dehydrogenase family protein n=1 Tax=uncultured Sphaerochaeta sp. TaxID=886478 RepID=UPI002A0A3814|nr:mannitol dehydrogenase family protein [uncultured Sphaerochaeta sp.]